MTVLGEGKAPTKAHIYMLGEKHGLNKKDIGLIVEQVSDATNRFNVHAQSAGVSKSTLKKIKTAINRNLDGFGGS